MLIKLGQNLKKNKSNKKQQPNSQNRGKQKHIKIYRLTVVEMT